MGAALDEVRTRPPIRRRGAHPAEGPIPRGRSAGTSFPPRGPRQEVAGARGSVPRRSLPVAGARAAPVASPAGRGRVQAGGGGAARRGRRAQGTDPRKSPDRGELLGPDELLLSGNGEGGIFTRARDDD